MLAEYFDSYVTRYQPYKGGRWCYEDGLIYRGLEQLHSATGDARWLDHLHRLADPQISADGALSGYDLSDYNIDNILAGCALLYLHAQTGEAKYQRAADLQAHQFDSHPRTKSGVFWHKLRYPWQIWLDGLYMGHPFRIAHAQQAGDMDTVQDSLRQISVAIDVLYDKGTGLYRHAYDEARTQPWADGNTGLSPALWSRAIGWLAMALVDVAALVGDAFAPLQDRTGALLRAVAAHRVHDGLWLQVIDRPDLAGNYQETSASAMFAYAFARGAQLGLVDAPPDLNETLLRQALKPKECGRLAMVDMCEVAGLGWYENRFRDGSAQYYISEARTRDDPTGVGPLMMLAAQAGL